MSIEYTRRLSMNGANNTNINTVKPINYSTKFNTSLDKKTEDKPPVLIDMSDKYSQDVIKNILKKVGNKQVDNTIYPCKYSINYSPENKSVLINNTNMKYSINYSPENKSVLINNTNMTNDATEIYEDGSVKHCGSWGDKELAPKGSFNDIIKEVETRQKEGK